MASRSMVPRSSMCLVCNHKGDDDGGDDMMMMMMMVMMMMMMMMHHCSFSLFPLIIQACAN